MKKYLFVVPVALAFLSACSRPQNALTAEGSTTVLPLAQKAAEMYMDAQPNISISIRGGGSGVGLNSLISSTADLAMSSRALKEEEKEKAYQNNITPHENIIAMDAIALIVNPSNKVSSLTKEQVKDIFTGKVTNWQALGGENIKIVVVSRDSASGTFEAFSELALNKEKVVPSALMQASNQGVAGVVASAPGAIGYVGLGYINAKTKALSINQTTPSVQSVLDKKYIYARPLYIYTNGAPKGETKAFLDFMLSIEGQRIASELGFVPVN